MCNSQAMAPLLLLPVPLKDRKELMEVMIFPQTCSALRILNVFLFISSSPIWSPIPFHSWGAPPNLISLPFWKFLRLFQTNQLFSPLCYYGRFTYIHQRNNTTGLIIYSHIYLFLMKNLGPAGLNLNTNLSNIQLMSVEQMLKIHFLFINWLFVIWYGHFSCWNALDYVSG